LLINFNQKLDEYRIHY